MAPKSPNAVGITIGPFQVGREIGRGAQGAVHLLHQSPRGSGSANAATSAIPTDTSGRLSKGAAKATKNTEDDDALAAFCVKLTPIPTTSSKKSPAFVNASSISKEAGLYRNIFPNLHGTFLPRLPRPRVVEAYGETEGFRYLIMERMEEPIFDALPKLVNAAKPSGTGQSKMIDLGSIAVKLLEIIQTFHELKYILVDVKPENFLLASSNSSNDWTKTKPKTAKSSSKRNNTTKQKDDLASRIRLVDLGLFQMWSGMPFRRQNESGEAELQGTPLYASANLHQGNSPSRRDDIESVLYILGEAVLRITAIQEGTTEQYEPSSSGTDGVPLYLPWSQETSDAAVGKRKHEAVSNPQSTYYSRMPPAVAQILHQALQEVQSYKFSECPNYDKLSSLLRQLIIPDTTTTTTTRNVVKARALTGPRAAAAVNVSGLRRSKRNAQVLAKDVECGDDYDDDDDSGVKIPRNLGEGSRYDDDDDDDGIIVDMEEYPNPGDAEDASAACNSGRSSILSEGTPMEVEMEVDDLDDLDASPGGMGRPGIVVEFLQGPKKGTSLTLVHGATESLLVGSRPDGVASDASIVIPETTGVGASHVKLSLLIQPSQQQQQPQPRCMLSVQDLDSGYPTLVDWKSMVAGSTCTVQPGQTIHVGGSVIGCLAWRSKDCTVTSAEVSALASASVGVPSIPTIRATGAKAPSATPAAALVQEPSTFAPPQGNPSTAAKAPPGTSTAGKENVMAKQASKRGVSLVVVEGPHVGDKWQLLEGTNEVLCLGSAPTQKGTPIVLSDDSLVGKNHVRFTLMPGQRLMRVKVTDLGAKGGTLLRHSALVAKGSNTALENDYVKLGATVIQIKRL